MDIGDVRGLLTAILFILFVGLSIWNFSNRRRADYEAAAAMPLEDDDTPSSESIKENAR